MLAGGAKRAQPPQARPRALHGSHRCLIIAPLFLPRRRVLHQHRRLCQVLHRELHGPGVRPGRRRPGGHADQQQVGGHAVCAPGRELGRCRQGAAGAGGAGRISKADGRAEGAGGRRPQLPPGGTRARAYACVPVGASWQACARPPLPWRCETRPARPQTPAPLCCSRRPKTQLPALRACIQLLRQAREVRLCFFCVFLPVFLYQHLVWAPKRRTESNSRPVQTRRASPQRRPLRRRQASCLERCSKSHTHTHTLAHKKVTSSSTPTRRNTAAGARPNVAAHAVLTATAAPCVHSTATHTHHKAPIRPSTRGREHKEHNKRRTALSLALSLDLLKKLAALARARGRAPSLNTRNTAAFSAAPP